MKTAVVISTRGFGVFRHDLLMNPDEVRLIGVFTDRDAANLTAGQRTWFEQIHVVPCGLSDPTPMLYSLVDADATREVVAGLLSDAEPTDLTVHCYDEQNMMVAAELRTRFGLKGPGVADILPFRDKCLMKQRLLDAGVRVPRFGHFDAEQHAAEPSASFKAIIAEVGLPFILKPTDAAASEGVLKITEWDEYAALPTDFGRAYEYEEFVEGTMYSVNIVSDAGRTVFGGVTEYLVNSLEVPGGKVNADINLIDSDPRVARMVAFADRALDALGRPDGGSHLELFHTPDDELVFLEVGARFKGMAGLAAMQRNYGIAFVNLAFEIESGIKSRPYDGEQIYCFDGVVPKKQGVVKELIDPELESDVEMTWKVEVGEEIESSNSLLANGGTFLVSNKDYEAAYRDFRRLADYRPIRYAEPSRVLGVTPAAPENAYTYFQELRLACETDPYDVHHDLEEGARDVVVLDVRRAAAYACEHVRGAHSLPHEDISAATVKGLDPEPLYVTYGWGPACNGGTRAAAKLSALGFKVKEMIGGFEYWKQGGHPTEQGEP
ncbi:rhodanese-like domain-containing protein [Streptomyces sp. NL15-2K]|uniref:rhodanese-like domain-containing protein n=1 Tax=Streptomyces sp. NL15-2K TaxID=376149 RepID=UPI000F587230|nr:MULTISPECIES: rhodanese-like domain-containing protein [Actinomycetes]WKX06069.1 ATP-grasp domain-containing protein [Kutzneria buriramensis]GCB52720.1 rhodanese-related sulfurtransferase [Streptomyces sp. NL15-2K]